MDNFSMIRLFTAFLLSILSISSFAGTAVLYPRFSAFSTGASSSTFGSTFKIPPTETLSSNWGVKSGYFWQSADAGSLAATSRMSAADAQAMNRAITGASKASQSAAKLLASGIIKASIGGVLATVVLDLGLEYLQGQWKKTTTVTPLGSQAPGYSFKYWGNWSGYDGTPFGGCPYGGTPGYYYSGGNRIRCLLEYSELSAPITSVQVPAVDSDFQVTRNLTDSELDWMVRNGYAVPIEKPPATVIGDLTSVTSADLASLTALGFFQKNLVTVNSGAPYTDPITGQVMQPKLSLSAAPNGGVRITTSDQPLNTDGTPATNPDGTPKPAEESKDPCAANPDSVSCSSLGSLDPSADPVPTTLNVSLTPGTLSTAGSCPAPRSLTLAGHAVVMSFQPICDASSTYIRPFVLLVSAVVSTFIFIGGLKS